MRSICVSLKLNRALKSSNEPKDIIELKPEEVDWSEIEPFLDDDLLNILLVGQDRRE